MNLLTIYYPQVLQSIIAIAVYFLLHYFGAIGIRKIAKRNEILENRTNLVIKYINVLLAIIAIIALILIWGVDRKNLFLTISSIVTVLGVAMFAQWSILSNITSGVILFFFFPFKIGDVIKIHDKDFAVQGEIIDITAFHITLIGANKTKMTYPNNLALQKGISIINTTFENKEFFD